MIRLLFRTTQPCMLAFLLWGSLLSGCAQIPLTHYYTFPPDSVDRAPASVSALPNVLAIGAFDATIPYQQDKIVFRSSPYEVGFYEYHKWLRPLPELVSAKVLEQGVASGMFARVHGQAFQVTADYILTGKIGMFDRWDSVQSSEARIRIAYQLLDSYGEQIIWMDTIESTAPVGSLESAVETVKSFEVALHANIHQALETIYAVVSRQ